jgi:hypothetical protein
MSAASANGFEHTRWEGWRAGRAALNGIQLAAGPRRGVHGQSARPEPRRRGPTHNAPARDAGTGATGDDNAGL